MALKAQAPVVPVAISGRTPGDAEREPDDLSGHVRVSFGEPVETPG